jgi:putative sterol carrier protein
VVPINLPRPAICKGELNGAMAYMKGKYKVEGKLSLLMKLDSRFYQ